MKIYTDIEDYIIEQVQPRYPSALEEFREKISDREARLLWIVTDHNRVRQAIGWTCAPNVTEYWWVPEDQNSHHFGTSAFDSWREAADAARRNIEVTHRRLDQQLIELYLLIDDLEKAAE